jgi:hypothetical protein
MLHLGRTAKSLVPLLLLVSTSCGGAGSTSIPLVEGDANPSDGVADATPAGDTGDPSDVGPDASTKDAAPPGPAIKTVFVIVLENHSWSTIKGSKSAPYINSLLPLWAHAEAYKTPPGNHPSEPNYIWLEAGDALGIKDDNPPSANHQSTTDHLVAQLEAKGISWKSYQEDIDGKTCPLTAVKQYDPKHNPMVYFDDMTDARSTTSKHCIDHVRPYTELEGDLSTGKVARYNFITPNLCNDMHGETIGVTCPNLTTDEIKKGDTWLSVEVPKILASNAWKDGGVLFITWDEGDEPANPLAEASDGPMGMIVLSPLAKRGYGNAVPYTHSSTLRTVETIFGLPFLRDAAKATDLSDLFTTFP